MKRQTLWAITVLLLFTTFTIRYIFFETQNISEISELPFFIIELATICLTVIIFAAVFASLIALIPFRQNKYLTKFTFLLPVISSLLLITGSIIYGHSAYINHSRGARLHYGNKFDGIEIPQHLDCSDVREGTFKIGPLLIKRSGNRQIETNTETQKISEFKIEWLNNCEYILTDAADETQFVKVKITNVSEYNYTCYVKAEQERKYEAEYIIERLAP